VDRNLSLRALAIITTAALSLVAVLADYFLKRASAAPTPFRTVWFLIGFLIYASTAFGTVFVFRHLKMAVSGVVYSVCLVLFLTVMGSVGFRETLRPVEMVGIVMALGSLVLLARFA
jgi:drug/metabolite transporter (DMT)-like permease